MLTAAGGGLSDMDLAELAGYEQWEIGELLADVSARTFTPRTGRWQPERTVYVLAHEELQQHAVRYLGTERLNKYRQRLHAWAEAYANRGWPPDTPEYLLRGYFRLLHSTNDLPRMLACATDRHRSNRMLDLTGGDTAALSEITTATDTFRSQPELDLGAMVRLALGRDHLTRRNALIPPHLPAVWAALGQKMRAEALARGIAASSGRDEALAALAREATRQGDYNQAQTLAATIANPYFKLAAFTELAESAIEAGEEQASNFLGKAQATLRSFTDDKVRAWAMIRYAEAAASARDHAPAKMAVAEIVRFPDLAAEAMPRIATALANNGAREQAVALVDVWEDVARKDAYADDGQWAMAMSVRIAAATGDLTRAEHLADGISEPYYRVQALTSLSKATASVGNYTTASMHARSAETYTNSIAHTSHQDHAIVDIVEALAAAKDFDHADALAGRIKNDRAHGDALLTLATAMAIAGNHDRAITITRGIRDDYRQAKAQLTLVTTLSRQEAYDHAEALARAIADSTQRLEALTAVARTLAHNGYRERVTTIAATVEESARHAADVNLPIEPITRLAAALAHSGFQEQASRIAITVESITCRRSRNSPPAR